MKWIFLTVVLLVVAVAIVAAIGARLPRDHVASRTLAIAQPPAVVWPALLRAVQASPAPVDVLENQPPNRLVTRVTQQERNFGGTWTITVVPTPAGSAVTVVENGWVANPIFRFVSRFVMGHHATMDGLLTQIAKDLGGVPALSGE